MRSQWKLPFINFVALQEMQQKKKLKTKTKKSAPILKKRSDIVTPDLVNFTVKVHNGIKYLFLHIKEVHVGYKYGNFTITKKRCIFKKKKK
jgi:ribosomal protein S19